MSGQVPTSRLRRLSPQRFAGGRNKAPGYHFITKLLHWGVFFLMAGQFLVGYLLEDSDSGDGSEDRLFVLHASLGLTILSLGIIRLVWRRIQSLPPWAPTLSAFERRYSHFVERVLYVLMLVIPLSGLMLAVADERPLPVVGEIAISRGFDDSDVEDAFEATHIGSHITFFLFFALHVGLVFKHQFFDRDDLLSRML